MRRLLTTLSILIVCAVSAWCGNVRLSVEAGRGSRTIEVGSVFHIFIEVSDIEGKPDMPGVVPGGKVMYFDHTGQSSSMTSINGRVTQSMSNTWVATVRANKEGEFSFGPISVGGVKSNTVRYTIGGASQPASQASAGSGGASVSDSGDKPKFIGKGDGNLFLRASVSESKVYEQQALVYTVKLYTTYDAIKFIGATSAPKFDGFVIEESKDISKSLSFETYNGKSYATAVIAKYIIFPQMTGNLKVVGNTYTVSVDQREYYQDPFWGSMAVNTPLQLNVTPNDLNINVVQLPEPKPSNFSGGVGNFTISAQLKSKEFKTNQAASVVYTVSGTGNLKYIQLPDMASTFPSELEVFTPTVNVKTDVGSSSVSGTSTFTYSFMPMEEGDFNIPPVELTFFNPATGSYQTVKSQGFPIHVAKGTGSARSQSSERAKFNPELQEVSMDALSKTHEPYIRSVGYWMWFVVPFVAFIVILVCYRRYLKEHADLVAFNSKRANKIANKRLKRAFKFMKQGDRDSFYDELLVALWGYLSYKLNIPTSELSRDNIRQVLQSRNVPNGEIDRMIEILDKSEYAKYSPDSSGDAMHGAYDEAYSIINALENSFKSK